MSDARIQREFPNVPEHLRSVALLAETLATATELEINRVELDARHTELAADIREAQATITASVTDLMQDLNEKDLAAGLEAGLLSPEDYRQALILKRTNELARDGEPELSAEHER